MPLPGTTIDDALNLDARDSLTKMRNRFHIPGSNEQRDVYFVGNSLGLQPNTTRSAVESVMDQWQQLGVAGHFEGNDAWIDLPEKISTQMADLVGAQPAEIVVMNTLTVNLHLMLASFFRPEGRRKKILIEEHAFPSDHQAVVSHLGLHGLTQDDLVIVRPAEGEATISTEQVELAIREHAESLALCLLPGVQYYTGQVFDILRLTQIAHRQNIPVGFDLAHAAGNLELKLHDWNVDFACWCTYKYMNCGPGAPGGCFIHERHVTDTSTPRLAGWWGHERNTRFLMAPEFLPPPTAQGWQLSNPPILALAPMLPALNLFSLAGGMKSLRARSRKQNAFFRRLLADRLESHVRIVTPDVPQECGCQLSLEIRKAKKTGLQVFRELTARGIHVDWREPNVIRAAPVPLYNTFEDIHRFVHTLEKCILGDT